MDMIERARTNRLKALASLDKLSLFKGTFSRGTSLSPRPSTFTSRYKPKAIVVRF
jgi:hypothetical protein